MHVLSEDDSGIALWIDLATPKKMVNKSPSSNRQKRINSETFTVDRLGSAVSSDTYTVKPPTTNDQESMIKSKEIAMMRSNSITSSSSRMLVTMVKKIILCNTQQ